MRLAAETVWLIDLYPETIEGRRGTGFGSVNRFQYTLGIIRTPDHLTANI